MSALSYKKNDDIESGALDKMTVYQECQRAFAESPINARKSRKLLAKLIHLLTTGETFSEFEATGLFIAVSKLFPHKDPSLRQIVYLAIKELVPLSNNDVIMVTSSITRDVQGSSDLIYKPNAIRALARVIDGSFVQGIERLMKTAIVDRHTSVSSAALVSAYHLLPIAKDTIRRWAAEVQEAVTSQKNFPAVTLPNYAPGPAVLAPYHALSLLYELRAHDRMALIKLIQQFSGASAHLQSPNANVMLIRFIAKAAASDGAHRQQLVSLLERYLGHKSDMVALEAAKAVLTLRDVSPKEASAAIESLRAFLASPRTIARFAAIRILNRFAMTNPGAVAVCNTEIQPLITDSNRSIATYAITALLKTGNEASVDKLVTQISGFMSDITDEFRIVVIDAVRSLALKFHAKKATMLQFFGNTLRNDGGSAQYKAAVVAALFDMIRYVPDCRDTALGILCEFIEDCEYTEIVVSVLHTLGQEGPAAANPTVYIRYIYNRIVLENAFIRAAAVSALAKFALVDDASVKKSVKVLLERSLEDETDEVRDRAVIALKLLESGDQAQAKAYISPESRFSLPILEHKLALYVTGSGADFDKPFDMSSVPLITDQEAREAALKAHRETTEATPVVNGGNSGTPASAAAATTANLASKSNAHEAAIQRAEKYAAELAAIPDLAAFGTPLKSSLAVALTESETEFVVTAIKHIFPSHVVLQYDVHNTLPDAQLTNVSVVASIEDDSEELVEEFILPVDELGPDSHGTVYVALEKTEDHLAVASFENILKFTLHDINKTTGEVAEDGDEDEYQIESLVVGAGDYLEGGFIGSFDHLWDELANTEAVDTATLSEYKGLEEAAQFLISQLSLTPLESSDEITSTSTHTLKLFGKTLTGEKVIVQIKMAASQRTGVVVQCKARSGDEEVAELVAGFVGSL